MPKSPEGGYVPSPEEEQNAEVAMTDAERKASEERDARIRAFVKKAASGPEVKGKQEQSEVKKSAPTKEEIRKQLEKLGINTEGMVIGDSVPFKDLEPGGTGK